MATVIFEDRVEVPLGSVRLEDFRIWAASPAFPRSGRIDYVSGTIEVERHLLLLLSNQIGC